MTKAVSKEVCDSGRQKWATPEFRRLAASEAETGIAGRVDAEGMS